MPFYFFVWSEEIVTYLALHGVTEEEFEEIVSNPEFDDISESSGRPIAFGETSTGKRLGCVYELLDDVTVLPVTAFEIEED
jgi:hypothetical protein